MNDIILYKIILFYLFVIYFPFTGMGQQEEYRFLNFEKRILLPASEINILRTYKISFSDSLIFGTEKNLSDMHGFAVPPQIKDIIMQYVYRGYDKYKDSLQLQVEKNFRIKRTTISYIGKLLWNAHFDSFLFYVAKPNYTGSSIIHKIILVNCKGNKIASILNISSYYLNKSSSFYTYATIKTSHTLECGFIFIATDPISIEEETDLLANSYLYSDLIDLEESENSQDRDFLLKGDFLSPSLYISNKGYITIISKQLLFEIDKK